MELITDFCGLGEDQGKLLQLSGTVAVSAENGLGQKRIGGQAGALNARMKLLPQLLRRAV